MITVHSIALQGLTPQIIEVGVSFVRGQPQLTIIGLPNRIITEAKERISAAVQQQGIRLRSRKVVVNLAPADLKKTDSYYELAIAVGLLKLHGELPALPANTAYFGEFSLEGALKPLRNPIPLLTGAKQLGFTKVVIPALNIDQAKLVSEVELYPLENMAELRSRDFFKRAYPKQPVPTAPIPQLTSSKLRLDPLTHRIITIAAAGGHNLLLVGPPGVGKTTAISALAGLLPPVCQQERLSLLSLYSLANKQRLLSNWQRPFRAPHHSSSRVSILGGTSSLTPGEISLAHAGVLFLDELTEFSRPVLEALREPMVEHRIRISRNTGQVAYPAQCLVAASCNPCTCGYYQSKKACQCSPYQIQQYRHRVSGPLLDRIELQHFLTDIYTSPSNAKPLSREPVLAAFSLQQQRYQPMEGLQATNGKVSETVLEKHLNLETSATTQLTKSATVLQLSLRSISQLKRIARTIADLEDSITVKAEHISEALQYRRVW